MRLRNEPLLDSVQIQARVRELAANLMASAEHQPFVLVVVLQGAAPFARDLAHACGNGVETLFITAKSYEGAASTGHVSVEGVAELHIAGRHVVIVEDILDTGATLNRLHASLSALSPASLRTCVLLDKPSRRTHPFTVDWAGFQIPDAFVVGYGLDYNDEFRDLPDIRVLDPD